jgi:hypothetical protein
VPLSSYLILFSGFALEITIAWRLAKAKLWREYPLFALYIVYVFAQSCLGLVLLRHYPASYSLWYWRTGIGSIFLRFILIWELFRHTFPKSSPLRRMVSRQTLFEVLTLVGILTLILWVAETYGKSNSVYLAMERSFGFVQAVLVLGILTLARYYHLRLGRNVWGIAVAFGLYCSLATAASAVLELAHFALFRLWYLLSPLSFVAMLGLWTWAVWSYEPNPAMNSGAPMDPTADFRQWSQDWGRAVSTVRKVSNR